MSDIMELVIGKELRDQVYTREQCEKLSKDLMAGNISVDVVMRDFVSRLLKFPCMIIWDECWKEMM